MLEKVDLLSLLNQLWDIFACIHLSCLRNLVLPSQDAQLGVDLIGSYMYLQMF